MQESMAPAMHGSSPITQEQSCSVSYIHTYDFDMVMSGTSAVST